MGSTELTIRDVEGIAELRRVGELQLRVADWSEHTAPLVALIASCEVGAILIGAFDGESLVGFVYGFPGYRGRRRILHSHMLAVDPAYRQLDLGYRLKLAQRKRAIAEGVNEITWTFDPLRSMNAYLNVNRLGVVAESYRPAYYGETCNPAARHIGTDRIWVRWPLDSERVRRRLEGGSSRGPTPGRLESALPLVRQGPDGRPVSTGGEDEPDAASVIVEIPDDIGIAQQSDPSAATAWRDATRQAFLACLAHGYSVEDFVRVPRGGGHVGSYLLEKGP